MNRPYEMRGTPDPGSGTRLVPMDELVEMLSNDPKMRAAVDTVERVEGKPRAVTMALFNALRHHRMSDLHVMAQKKAIDMAVAKKRGGL